MPVHEDRFFGFIEQKVLGEPVQMATVERALVDALDRPRYAGGIGEVSRVVARAARRASWEALLGCLRRFAVSALAQRLGYLIELNGVEVPADVLAALHGLVGPGSKVTLGPGARWGRHGRLSRAWGVIENVPGDVLLAADERSKRRVSPGKSGGT